MYHYLSINIDLKTLDIRSTLGTRDVRSRPFSAGLTRDRIAATYDVHDVAATAGIPSSATNHFASVTYATVRKCRRFSTR